MTIRLTDRQRLVAHYLAARRTNQEIAKELGVTVHTVKRHVEAALLKLGVRSRRDVAAVLTDVSRAAERT